MDTRPFSPIFQMGLGTRVESCMPSLIHRPLPSFPLLAERLSRRGPGIFSHISDVTGRMIVDRFYRIVLSKRPYPSKCSPPYFGCFCGLGSSLCNHPPCNLWYFVILHVRARAVQRLSLESRKRQRVSHINDSVDVSKMNVKPGGIQCGMVRLRKCILFVVETKWQRAWRWFCKKEVYRL